MQFEKVPFEEYKRAYENIMGVTVESAGEKFEDWLKLEWENIRLPTRATEGSAGYDFYSPSSVNIVKNHPVILPTGIRVMIDPGWFLMLFPRSGLGFKYGMRLENTCGIIDEDYFQADNYGHIMAKISVKEDVFLQPGDRFMQGIFMQYGLVKNDKPMESARRGGFGSTGV